MRSSSLVVIGLLCAASPALAQSDPAQALTAEHVRPGVHRHDGFYLRIGTGFGGYSEGIKQQNADQTTNVSGMATVGEIAIGGAVRPGFMLGGGIWSSSVVTSDRTVHGTVPPEEVIGGSGNFSLIGPFIDWYFNPRRGFHLQAALGFATVRGFDYQEAKDNPDAVSYGGGAMVGFGYEWWVSEQWSFGILSRVAGVVAAQKDKNDATWTHTLGSTPSLLFTATYN